MTNDELIELILPWAKEHHPDKYAKTIEQANRPIAFRRFLVRLIEIRCAEDRAWRNTVPLSVLEETSLSVTLRHKGTGREFTVGGQATSGRHVSFRMLGMCLHPENASQAGTLDAMLTANDVFDLEMEGT